MTSRANDRLGNQRDNFFNESERKFFPLENF